MKMKERVAEAIYNNLNEESGYVGSYKFYGTDTVLDGQFDLEIAAQAAIKAMHEPDPNAVAKAADQLNMDVTKVAAVWMVMVEEMSK